LPIKAIREYADAGLVYSVGRTAAGYRLFQDEALWCIEMICGLRALGRLARGVRAVLRHLPSGHPILSDVSSNVSESIDSRGP